VAVTPREHRDIAPGQLIHAYFRSLLADVRRGLVWRALAAMIRPTFRVYINKLVPSNGASYILYIALLPGNASNYRR
jgi:hypothetical protein